MPGQNHLNGFTAGLTNTNYTTVPKFTSSKPILASISALEPNITGFVTARINGIAYALFIATFSEDLVSEAGGQTKWQYSTDGVNWIGTDGTIDTWWIVKGSVWQCPYGFDTGILFARCINMNASGVVSSVGSGAVAYHTIDQDQITNLVTDLGDKEPSLGDPTTDGYVLSSTALGVRSWVANTAGEPSTTIPNTEEVADTGAIGTSTYYARADHEHPMPGLATESTPGFMSASDKSTVDNISGAYQPISARGQANGYAELDTNALIPVSELPLATPSTLGAVKPDGSTITIASGIISAPGSTASTASKVILMGSGNFILTSSSQIIKPVGQAPLQITLPSAGWYHIKAILQLLGSSTANQVYIASLYNITSPATVATEQISNVPANTYAQIVVEADYYVSASATIGVYAYNSSAAGGTVEGRASLIRYDTIATDSAQATPNISSFTPLYGDSVSVVITGSGFTGATSVYFGVNAASSFTVNSDTQITATSPSSFTNGSITVITPGGTAVSAGVFSNNAPRGILYATKNDSSSGGVYIISQATNTVTNTISVGANPNGLAITPNYLYLYVANHGASGSGTTVSVVSLSSNTVIATVTVGTGPYAVAIDPTGTYAFVTNSVSGTVSVIQISSNTVVATITVGSNPNGVAINPAGTYAYVANDGTGTISVISISSLTVVATITGLSQPDGIAIDPSGTYAYVANGSGSVAVVQLSSNTVYKTISGVSAFWVAINPTGNYVYVSSGSGPITIIDTSSLSVTGTMTGTPSSAPDGIACSADGNYVYACNNNSAAIYYYGTQGLANISHFSAGECYFIIAT